ncbi:5'-nucleotidase [Iodobacter sp. LRB]|uniref:5'-nucleotidase n=1 Tax=unclassified Iodobacter TaxID=235634 RepID=UPI000C0EF397|nr:5'-nucleotidase [Iodobacter sp. BJB302]PHV00087.1 5'-nucleotidase [Iodobacter sp. BJB302]
MPASLDGQLVIAISSRALFDFEAENLIFDQADDQPYMALQLDKIDEPASPGMAYSLVKKLLAFNSPEQQRVEVVILSRNDPVSGLRVFKSCYTHGLPLLRGVFTRGRPAWSFLEPLQANLFLSADEADVRDALAADFAAARVYPKSASTEQHPDEIRIAFDGDAVLFSDEAERVYQQDGLHAFQAHESAKVQQPLPPGPFKSFLQALHRLQKDAGDSPMKIRTALVTARSAPAHERAIRTLMSWNIQIDEAYFLGGLEKGPFLKVFAPDLFFDDQTGHCDSAASVAPTAHVAAGISNTRQIAD